MKLSTGLSEEEAIRDFGSVEELAAQILEAYHVKPEYQTVKTEKKLPDMTGVTQEGKRLWGTVSHFFKGAAKAAGDLGRTCWKKTDFRRRFNPFVTSAGDLFNKNWIL